MSLEDIYGRRIHLKRVQVDTPGLLPADTVAMKTILVDTETGKEIDPLLDVGSHVFTRQANGTYLVSRVIEGNEPKK